MDKTRVSAGPSRVSGENAGVFQCWLEVLHSKNCVRYLHEEEYDILWKLLQRPVCNKVWDWCVPELETPNGVFKLRENG